MHDEVIDPASATDLAIDSALAAAGLRAGDSLGATVAHAAQPDEPSAAEAGDGAGSDAD